MVLIKSIISLLGVAKTVASLSLTVASSGGNASSPLLYGLLYEDVYHSGDGGLYSELIQNRAFQGSIQNGQASTERSLQFWHNRESSDLQLDTSGPVLSAALPYHMRVDVSAGATGGPAGMWNEGFAGMNVTTATRYACSFYLWGNYNGPINCTFWSNTTNGQLGATYFTASQTAADGWVHYAQTFTTIASAPDEKNTLHVTFNAASTAGTSLHFHMISVFQQTYKNSNNGLRMDLAEGVNAIGGKYLRLPGGNNMEGTSSPYRWIWNNTIGPIIDRPGRPGTWGYFNTDGLGLLEMMQWTIDMDLEPILAVWAGLYLDGEVVAQADLQYYVDDVMNELEFLLGPSSSTYGAQRASLGYQNPFSIKYVEIGNEDYLNNGQSSYVGYRFNMFYSAIKEAYPDMIIISSVDVGQFSNPPAGMISDLHLYQSAAGTVGLFNAFDNRPRNNPVLVGEYAAIFDSSTGTGGAQLDNPSLESATSEAIMFLGLERNADVVLGSSHGALIKSIHDDILLPNDNVAMMKHTPSQIVFSMSYYVAKMFASNYGDDTVPTTSDSAFGPLYWSSTKSSSGMYFVKIVNFDGASTTPVTVSIPGSTASVGKLITYTAPSKSSTNTLDNIQGIWSETTVEKGANGFIFTLNGSYITSVLVV